MKKIKLRKDVIHAMADVTKDDVEILQDEATGNMFIFTELPGYCVQMMGSLSLEEGEVKTVVYADNKAYLCDKVEYVDHMHELHNPEFIGYITELM